MILKVTTVGGTVHYLDPGNGQRMRVPGEGRGRHYGDGEWRPMSFYAGYEDDTEVELSVGSRAVFVGPDFSWFLTSPVISIEELRADALVD